jgi:alkaline phosphatase
MNISIPAGVLACLFPLCLTAQVNIHSHNDYDHPHPFWGAYGQKAFSIEADVYLRGDSLMVAHQSRQIRAGHTLESMYLRPVEQLFAKYKRHVSADPRYTFYLMIDIKESWEKVLPVLIRKLAQHRDDFDRSTNPSAVQVFISGNRPPDTAFRHYPPWIAFDGLPHKHYALPDLEKVIMISDNFATYSKWDGKGLLPSADKDTLKALILAARRIGKPFRFWGAPDTPECWEQLHALGAAVINTDQVAACRKYFMRR